MVPRAGASHRVEGAFARLWSGTESLLVALMFPSSNPTNKGGRPTKLFVGVHAPNRGEGVDHAVHIDTSGNVTTQRVAPAEPAVEPRDLFDEFADFTFGVESSLGGQEEGLDTLANVIEGMETGNNEEDDGEDLLDSGLPNKRKFYVSSVSPSQSWRASGLIAVNRTTP